VTTENLGDPLPPGGPEPRRRIALLPLVLIVTGVLAAIVFAVVVAGLASTTVVGPAPSESAGPSIPAPPAADALPSTAPRPAAGPNECVDDRLDGVPVDLDSVALSADGDRLRVVVVLTEELPDGESGLAVVAENADGVRYELVSTWDDGELDDFVMTYSGLDRDGDRDNGRGDDKGDRDEDARDKDDSGQEDLRSKDISNEGTVIVATFPRSVLGDLGEEFSWYAFATADGSPVDSCPGAVEPGESLVFRR
jgi:hypothetical protein